MKWLFRGAATLFLLLLLAVLVLVLVPTERVAQLAAVRFEAATGRGLTIGGPVKATLWPRLGIRAEGVEVANADWSDEGPMLTAETLEVGIALASLFGGDIRIETLKVEGAKVVLERQADGRANWDLATSTDVTTAAAPTTSRSARGFSIDRAVLAGADVTWIDHGPGSRLDLGAVDLATGIRDLDSPVQLTGSALLKGQAITLEASVDALRPLLEGALTPVILALTAGQTSLQLDGRMDLDPPSFEGMMEATSSDGIAIAHSFGATLPSLPQGLGRDLIEVKADVTLAPAGTLHLRDMVLDLDRTRLTGALDIAIDGDRPRVVGTLSTEALDLAASDSGGQRGETGQASQTGAGPEAIDVSGLFLLDADLTLSTGTITLDDATIDELRARLTLDQGRLIVTLQPLLAYGGTVTGDVVVNARGGLSSRATLQASGLEMQPLLTDFADFDRLVGQADLALDVLGVGNTVQALIESLDGTASFRIGRGEILGLDIGGMVRTLDPGFRGQGQKTVFDAVSGSFVITDGIAVGEDLSLTAEYLTMRGAGRISLGPQTISYRLLPTLRRGTDSEGVTVPILIEGPWADPRIRPDLEYLARQKLEVERNEIEARAQNAARAKLAEELNVAPEALDNRSAVEDAVKEKLENEVLDLLFGR